MRIARTASDHCSPQKWIMTGMMAEPRAMAPMSGRVQRPEHPAHHLVVGLALQDRRGVHVDHRVRDAR